MTLPNKIDIENKRIVNSLKYKCALLFNTSHMWCVTNRVCSMKPQGGGGTRV